MNVSYICDRKIAIMASAVKIFFPLVLLGTLLKAGETDRKLLIRSLQEYCMQTQDPEEREALEIRLAQLQSALAHHRIRTDTDSFSTETSVTSPQSEISLLFNDRKPAGEKEHACLFAGDKDNRRHFRPQNGLRAVTLPAYPF